MRLMSLLPISWARPVFGLGVTEPLSSEVIGVVDARDDDVDNDDNDVSSDFRLDSLRFEGENYCRRSEKSLKR